MRIKVVIPNSSQDFRDEQTTHRKQVAMKGTTIDVVCLLKGPASLEAASDESYAAPYILDEIKKAEQDGYDAATIDCACDPALRASREISSIPVIGAGEASWILALTIGDKFSVITVLSNTADVIKHNILASQFDGRLASIRSAEIPVLELKNHEAAKAAILREAKKALKEDGADVIVLGCTGMAKLAKEVQKELGVPVVEPATAAIKIAEILVQMRLSHSKRSFKTPPEKEIL